MVVPAIERICAQLFKQLNDNFRHGLDQNSNVITLQALNQGDQTALEFVCNNVDPDEIFRYPGTLSQPVLLSLLQQLSLRLDSDTDLKFRYMEHIVDVLQPHDDDISVMVPKVIDGLMQSLTGSILQSYGQSPTKTTSTSSKSVGKKLAENITVGIDPKAS
ncbi:hypothetical protein TELCIR_09035 [Teladorsagia circumcincta]|uniref:Enhancer of mRNA-decapping protein 4 C-terminal domain-containing protein n=1 Tax=Teladorsagia circumcincta TaxID=45464 RepID=A0A2G9UHD7_TELCI|nr:hypothetical protein TELCIR_09035 [Teladorsagia circumcincta]